MNLFVDLAIKSVVLLAFVAVVAALLRGSSAATRHRVWALGFLALAALPLLSLKLPGIRIERPALRARTVHTVYAPRPAVVRQSNEVESAPTETPAPPPRPFDPVLLFIFVWEVGAFVLLARTTLQILLAMSWTRGGEEISGSPSLEVPPHTRVIRTLRVEVPMTLGFLRPTILLPNASKFWSEERLDAVLLHEAAHVRRSDWAWLIFSRLIGAIYWLNPLVYFAAARMRLEGELAADDAVLNAGIAPPNYAEALVELADGLRRRPPVAALPFVETGTLKFRVSAILSAARRRGPLRRSVAFGALLVGAIVVTPFAAAQIVQGPTDFPDGIVELPDGSHAEIVAITEMRGKRAISWDMHGALLPRPLPMGEPELSNFKVMKPVPPGSKVRYAIVRLENPTSDVPTFSAPDNNVVEQTYFGGEIYQGAFTDALGGVYRVLQIVARPGEREIDLHAKIALGEAKLYAYKTYRDGEERESYNPAAEIRIAPQMPKMGKGTDATFVLPPASEDQAISVRFFPRNEGGLNLVGIGGNWTASTSIPPESLTRVEILSQALTSIRIPNVPLEPKPGATYVSRRFLPADSITAKGGSVRLADGTRVGIESLSSAADYPGVFWNAQGNPVETKMPQKFAAGRDRTLPRVSGQRQVRLWIERQPDGYSDPSVVYDGEGWPLMRGFVSHVNSDRLLFRGFVGNIEDSLRQSDVSVPIAAGPYQTLARFQRTGTDGSKWSFSEREEWSGVLSLRYPESILSKQSGEVETRLTALDEKGDPVSRPDGGRIYSESGGLVEFDLPRSLAAKVKTVRLEIRPYTWIRFPNVALAPNRKP